jgi:hypothetical protein
MSGAWFNDGFAGAMGEPPVSHRREPRTAKLAERRPRLDPALPGGDPGGPPRLSGLAPEKLIL